MKTLLMAGALALVLISSAAFAQDTSTSPCGRWAVITPSDTADLPMIPKAIYVGTGGDLNMIGAYSPSADAGAVWKGVPSASLVAARPRRILAQGTSATDLLACF